MTKKSQLMWVGAAPPDSFIKALEGEGYLLDNLSYLEWQTLTEEDLKQVSALVLYAPSKDFREKSKVSKFLEILVIGKTLPDKIESNFSFCPTSLSILDQDLLFWNYLKRCQHHESFLGQDALEDLGFEVQQTLDLMKNELYHLKDNLKTVSDKKKRVFKNFSVESKYEPGLALGGEFFDFIGTNDFLVVCLFSCSSYVVSNIALTELSRLKKAESLKFNDLVVLKDSVIEQVKKKNIRQKNERDLFSYCMLYVDQKTLQGQILKTSDFLIYYRNQNLAENDFTVERKQRLLIFSPGLDTNFEMGGESNRLHEIVSEKGHLPSFDFCHEIFYNLSRFKKDGFLEYDASCILLEVDDHALHQI